MAPVELVIRGRHVMTFLEGQEQEFPSTKPETGRKSLFVRGGADGGWYSTDWEPFRKGSDPRDTLQEIKPGQTVVIDEGTTIRGK